jgi:hypothetical protein
VAGSVQVLLPGAPAHAPANEVQQPASAVQVAPTPMHVVGVAQTLAAQTFPEVQQGSEAQEAPALAHVGAGAAGAGLEPPPLPLPPQAPRTSTAATASARDTNVGRAVRAIGCFPPGVR